MKKEHELTPKEKYFVFSGNNPKTHMKPVTHGTTAGNDYNLTRYQL